MKYQVIAVDTDSLRSAEHKHHKKDGWFKVYYYKDSKRTQAKVKQCSSFKCFRNDTFYKVQALSVNDPLFDYYKIKKRNIKGSHFAKRKERGRSKYKIDAEPYKVEFKTGKFVLEF